MIWGNGLIMCLHLFPLCQMTFLNKNNLSQMKQQIIILMKRQRVNILMKMWINRIIPSFNKINYLILCLIIFKMKHKLIINLKKLILKRIMKKKSSNSLCSSRLMIKMIKTRMIKRRASTLNQAPPSHLLNQKLFMIRIILPLKLPKTKNRRQL